VYNSQSTHSLLYVFTLFSFRCPHCQHFRDNFVQLAKQITSIARDQGGVENIKVYSVSCTVFRDLCKHFGVDSYPQIKLFTANSTNVTASLSYWKLHPFDILNKLGVQVGNMDFMEKVPEGGNVKLKIRKGLGQGGAEQATDSVKGKNNINHANGDESSPELYRRTKKDLFSDAYLSFHFALKTGIYMSNGPLTNTTRAALHSWLSLLEKSMPPTWHIQNLIRALLKNFDSITQGEDQLLAVVNQFPPRSKNWSRACSHGEKGAGYTCGLWQLFHIMTVGVVEWNLMIYEDLDMMLDVSEAALTLRNYVEHFFGCEVCRVNFVGAYDTCAHDRCNRLHQDAETDSEWMQLPLWLFETHNSVNIRLLKERAEREKWPQLVTRDDEIKKEWPSRLECPKCWREDGGWDEKTVYRYMRTEYWPEDTITQVYREEMQDSGDDRRGEFTLPPMAVQLIPIGLVLAMAAAWYKKKLERTRSGLHKRRD
jgi:Erv1 / Alr family/Thioredoxin